MPITDLLERNARKYPNDVSLVEINPDIQEQRRVTWRDYELIETNPLCHYRREITWHVFDEKANRFAQLLISRGIRKGDKVAILLMNCLEWLPIYFGILKTGALAVPLNFRYAPDEIEYCLDLAEVDVLVFVLVSDRNLLEEWKRSLKGSAKIVCCFMWEETARLSQRIMINSQPTVPVCLRESPLKTVTMRRFIFLREPPDFQKQFYITMKV